MEPRTCRNCQKRIPLDEGYKFDGYNLICEKCGEVAFEGNVPKKEFSALAVKDTTCEASKQKPYSV